MTTLKLRIGIKGIEEQHEDHLGSYEKTLTNQSLQSYMVYSDIHQIKSIFQFLVFSIFYFIYHSIFWKLVNQN